MDLIKRICISYYISLKDKTYINDSLWDTLIINKSTSILNDVFNLNIEKTKYHLENPNENELTWGFDHMFVNSFTTLNEVNEYNKE